MPLMRCQRDGKPGWKWGRHGYCYTGPRAKERALRQARAILAQNLNPLQVDPSRTSGLRRRMVADLRRRFDRLKQAIDQLIVEENAFGLVTHTRWQFATTPEQLAEFERWLESRISRDVLVDQDYWQAYVEEGYRKGMGRAFDDVHRMQRVKAYGTDAPLEWYYGTREDFLEMAFGQPIAVERVKTLAARTFMDLKGATQAMATTVKRVLADGLVAGQNPKTIARAIKEQIDGIGKRRAVIIARTEIIRAHAEGQLDGLEALGVDRVGVMVEWEITKDGRTCPLCTALDGVTLPIHEARGMIPRHPQCRCAWIPAYVGEGKVKGRVATRRGIRGRVLRSVEPEGGLEKSRWLGADRLV